ncbi:hypothetical protein [Bradyrhizobium sp.]|uniref:hypothetical protein n=1 Tax=Bradyrhizobium sp. TaxID=376 RepID=UPI0025C6F02C|nr:hypothetical protein [Bradyrhizobium sp.]
MKSGATDGSFGGRGTLFLFFGSGGATCGGGVFGDGSFRPLPVFFTPPFGGSLPRVVFLPVPFFFFLGGDFLEVFLTFFASLAFLAFSRSARAFAAFFRAASSFFCFAARSFSAFFLARSFAALSLAALSRRLCSASFFAAARSAAVDDFFFALLLGCFFGFFVATTNSFTGFSKSGNEPEFDY